MHRAPQAPDVNVPTSFTGRGFFVSSEAGIIRTQLTERGIMTETKNQLSPLSHLLRLTSNVKLLDAATKSKGIDRDRFVRCAWIQIQLSDDLRDLAEKKPVQIFRALLQCAGMGLYPDGISGDAYLVRFKDSCAAIRGYKGLMRLFAANPVAAHLPFVADVVREKDQFSYQLGSEPRLSHTPAHGERGEITHYYAVARFRDGACLPKVMTVAEVEKYKVYAKTMKFWDAPEENTRIWMRLKTVIRQLIKLLPLADNVKEEVERDEAVEAGNLPEDIIDVEPIAGDTVQPTQPKADAVPPVPALPEGVPPIPVPTPTPQPEGASRFQGPPPQGDLWKA